jgi:hypothetical protein
VPDRFLLVYVLPPGTAYVIFEVNGQVTPHPDAVKTLHISLGGGR